LVAGGHAIVSVEGSNIDRSEVAALARAFARHLEHLRMFRGVHYVPAGAVPVGAVLAEPVLAEPVLAEPVRVEATIEAAVPVPVEPPSREPARPSAEQWSAAKKLQYLRERNVGDCHRCPLAATRRNIVFGVGNPEAELMFVGEAPGADEDRLGEPFVGAAGQRLDQWITHLGLRRDQVYIANVLKCRPPGNRDPKPLEIERCSPFLHAQIRAVEPKVLVALGRFAGCLLLGRELKLYEMRGAVHRYHEPKSGTEIPLVVTYHPSYVIRREKEPGGQAKPDRGAPIKSEDEKVRDDLQRAHAFVKGLVKGLVKDP
jgi:uracil-DNA glycosylase family 4